MNLDPMIEAFFEETAELLADFEASLLQLEEAPDDQETLNRIFRCAHTIKGNSSMLGFDAVAHFTHALEDLLDRLRKGEISVTPPLMDTLLGSVDAVKELIAAAKGGTAIGPERHETLLKAIQSLAGGAQPEESPSAAPQVSAHSAAAGRQTLYEIDFAPPADLMRRGLDPLQFLQALSDLGQLLKVEPDLGSLPPLMEMEPERSYLRWKVWLLSARPQPEVEACFEFMAEPGAVTIEALPMENDGDGPVAREEEEVQNSTKTRQERQRPTNATAVAGAASIRVPIDKVDRLINLVGEMVITQSMVAETVASFTPEKLARLEEAVAQMDRHARELHERMMAVRMIPIKTLFSRFPRVVRDLAGAAGKQAALEVIGEETELDKTVIEKIGDPLTHLVRNALDHGIESPEERRAAGKPEAGKVRMEAYQQGGSIYIEVADDGKGLDRERIIAKAVQNGLVTPGQILSDEEAFALVFRPGLSTAEKVTEVSGRGVGMDVVKRNVESLGGSITIRSEVGKGTCFRIKLPLTLAIVDGQALQVGDETYILPLVAITESVRPTPGSVHSLTSSAEVVMVRDKALPLLRLHRLFGVAPKSEDPTQGLVVIVEHEGQQGALLVDELLGQQQVVIKSLEANFQRVEGVSGATIMGDGQVALILDVAGLVALSRASDSLKGNGSGAEYSGDRRALRQPVDQPSLAA